MRLSVLFFEHFTYECGREWDVNSASDVCMAFCFSVLLTQTCTPRVYENKTTRLWHTRTPHWHHHSPHRKKNIITYHILLSIHYVWLRARTRPPVDFCRFGISTIRQHFYFSYIYRCCAREEVQIANKPITTIAKQLYATCSDMKMTNGNIDFWLCCSLTLFNLLILRK